MRLAGEPLGGEAEAEQARDAPRAVSVQGARSDLMPGLCVVLICVCDWGFRSLYRGFVSGSGSGVYAGVDLSMRR